QWRLQETERTRGGAYGAGVSNPLVQTKAGGAALDLGFYNGGHHSWGYEGKAVHAHFSPATLGPGSGEDLAFWDDSANPDMAAGPSLLRQDGGGGGMAGAPGQDEGLKALALPAPNRPLQLLRQRLNGSFQSGLNLALTDQIDVESSIGEMEPGLRVRSVLALLAMADPYLNDFLGNYITKGAFNVETSGRSAMSLWLYEAAPWYDGATNTLYVPASWTAGQVVDFLTEYAHDLNNPMGRRFLAELQTNGIFSGRIGFEEYNSLLKQGLAATAEQAEGLVRQAISLGPGGDLALAAWDAQNDGIISAALTFAKSKSQDLALGASLGVMIGVVAKRLNAPNSAAARGLARATEHIEDAASSIAARHRGAELAGLGDDAIPFVSDIGPQKGWVVGRQSPDGLRVWRMDWDPNKGYHVNWWDRTGGTKRKDWLYGAIKITDGTWDDYIELLKHGFGN
ncbi:MAG: hypothetical protein ACK6DN_00005, partial [Planctomycetota bacterium]